MEAEHNHYIESINRVIDYIDLHLEKTLSLDELSGVGNFSKFHFHRIFQNIMKESLFEYILRLRLERAASQIILQPKKSLSEIGLQCGFSDLSIFSRNFKKHFNHPPSAFRKGMAQKSNLSQIDRNQEQPIDKPSIYFCPHTSKIKWTSNMEFIKSIEIQSSAKLAVAYNRNIGPYKGNNELYQKHREELFAWAASKELMSDPRFKYIILYHDNPNVSLNDNQRMSLCVTVPENTKVGGIIGKMDIEGGKYLVCKCELSANDFSKVWDWIYGQWFPNNNYVPADKPYFELYPEQPKGIIFKVDFYIPVVVVEKE